MKTSRKKFIILFLVSAFAFMAITNLLLQPAGGDWFPGTHSPIAWQRTLAAIIYPVKIVLLGPLPQFLNDPDPAPPVRIIACALYWVLIAVVLHFILSKVMPSKKA